MNIRIMAVAVFGLFTRMGSAEQFYARPDIADWTKAESFSTDEAGKEVASRVPGSQAHDEVIVLNNSSVTVGDAASLEVVNRLDRIRPAGSKAQVVFVVPANACWTNGCPVNYDGVSRTSYDWYGRLIKRGGGTLELKAPCRYLNSSYLCDYCTTIVAEEGDVVLPQTDGTGSYSGKTFYNYGYSVSNNATLHLASGMQILLRALRGEPRGVITNSNAGSVTLTMQGETSGGKHVDVEYSGVLGGAIDLRTVGRLLLTGTKSTMSGGVMAYNNGGKGISGGGIAGIRHFGMKTDAFSSVGADASLKVGYATDANCSGGGIWCCATAEDGVETTDKDLLFYSHTEGADFVNAGDFGGVTFTGAWSRPTAETSKVTTRQMGEIDLYGENKVHPCVIKGAVKLTTYSSVRYPFHFVKRGSGIWKIADQTGVTPVNKDRDGIGAATVEEGTLQVESIGRKYDLCSLGTGRDMMSPHLGARDETKRVDWNVALGAPGKEGALEYVGTTAVNAYSRPLVFKGNARLINSSSASVRYLALAPEGACAKTVTLDGSNALENELSDVTDTAEHPVSVVKEGSGKWVLGGNLTFHGPLTVKGGELVLRTYPKKYSWYKWIVKQSYTNENFKTPGDILCSECFAIYDASNIRQNGNLAVVTNAFAALQPGQVTCETTRKIEDFSGARPWSRLFADIAGGFGMYLSRVCDAFGDTIKAMADDPNSWLPFVMRLHENATEVVAWDYVANFGRRNNGATPVSERVIGTSTIEGSPDGIHWENVLGGDKSVIGEELPYQNGCWVSAGSTNKDFQDGDAANHTSVGVALEIPSSFRFAKTKPKGFSVLPNGVAVKVSGNGTLKTEGGSVTLNALTVDMEQGGTIDGFAFADQGRITVENFVSDGKSATLPIRFTNAADQVNLAKWDLEFVGARQYRRKIAVAADGTVSLEPFGLTLILR